MKNKIIPFIIALAVSIPLFVIPCFALDFSLAPFEYYTFNDTLDFTDATFDRQYFEFVVETPDDVLICNSMQYSYRGYHVIDYYIQDGNTGEFVNTTVYTSDEGWVDESYKTFYVVDIIDFHGNFGTFLSINENENACSSLSPIYSTIFDLVSTYIFGEITEGSYQELVCIILSTILCLLVFTLPFAVVFFVQKLILSVGDRLL